jgi:hypothetical protein
VIRVSLLFFCYRSGFSAVVAIKEHSFRVRVPSLLLLLFRSIRFGCSALVAIKRCSALVAIKRCFAVVATKREKLSLH